MDSLILTFNKEPMHLYKELLQKENIDLNFNTHLEFDEISRYSFDEALSNIEKEATKLLNFKKNNVSFSPSLTADEIKLLIPIYYKVIRNIKQQKSEISSFSLILTQKIEESNKIIADINKRYSDFLPYKAALYNKDEYKEQIEKLQAENNGKDEEIAALRSDLEALQAEQKDAEEELEAVKELEKVKEELQKLEEENEELRKLAEDKEVSGVVVVNEENKGQEGVDISESELNAKIEEIKNQLEEKDNQLAN